MLLFEDKFDLARISREYSRNSRIFMIDDHFAYTSPTHKWLRPQTEMVEDYVSFLTYQ